MLQQLFKKREARRDAVAKVRESFTSWHEISNSNGWKAYQEILDKKIENIRHKIEYDLSLSGEDLKRLQLALQVYVEVKRIPKDLEEKTRGGLKHGKNGL